MPRRHKSKAAARKDQVDRLAGLGIKADLPAGKLVRKIRIQHDRAASKPKLKRGNNSSALPTFDFPHRPTKDLLDDEE